MAVKQAHPKLTLNTQEILPVKKLENLRTDQITTSTDPDIASFLAQVRKPTVVNGIQGSIQKWFIPIDISNFTDTGFSIVPGAIKVPRHSHDRPIFSILVSGSLTINGIHLSKYDWYLVPPKVTYEIQSETGYEAVFCYIASC